MAQNAKFGARVSSLTGRFLSSVPNVLSTLGIYVVLSWLTYFVLTGVYGFDQGKAFRITYAVAGAGDPFALPDVQQHYWLWRWLLVFRVLAWLLIPVLVATAVDAAYRVFETNKKRSEARVRRQMRKIGREQLNLTGSALDEFVNEQYEQFVAEA